MSRKISLAVVFCAIAFCMASSAFAQKGVLRVVAVQTDKVDEYVQEIEKGKALLKKNESQAKIRVWIARFAGNESGTVVVSVEYSSLAALAADDEKMRTNAELQAWLKGLDKIRKIVSDSIYYEL